jgi:Serine/threonine protein kinase
MEFDLGYYVIFRVEGGELFQLVNEREWLSEDLAVRFIKQILDALEHMHNLHIAHLDLKVSHVLTSSHFIAIMIYYNVVFPSTF